MTAVGCTPRYCPARHGDSASMFTARIPELGLQGQLPEGLGRDRTQLAAIPILRPVGLYVSQTFVHLLRLVTMTYIPVL